MTQRERDRLVALRKAKKKLITQREAAEEIGVSERHVRRMLKQLRKRGDHSVVHGLRGRPSNRRVAVEVRDRIVEILSGEMYQDFGPTLASEYLRKQHGIQMGREALRQLLMQAGRWRPRRRKAGAIHAWRERKARFGELVQWDTSDHDWLEGRGDKIYLIHMIDDATSRLRARFVVHDSTEENLKQLEDWVRRYGRPLGYYTDKASLFHNAPKRVDGADVKELPPTQIGRALEELQIAAIKAHSPQAKGRVERSFQTAQDRLVKGMRVAGVCTIEQANAYLEREFLPWWEARCTVLPINPDDAHRPVGPEHELAAALSIVHTRKIVSDYTFRFEGQLYRIERCDIRPGLRGARVRIERRREGTLAVRFQAVYLRFAECDVRPKAPVPPHAGSRQKRPPTHSWMRSFTVKDAPPLREIYRRGSLSRI